jgi:hypothetical protein
MRREREKVRRGIEKEGRRRERGSRKSGIK